MTTPLPQMIRITQTFDHTSPGNIAEGIGAQINDRAFENEFRSGRTATVIRQ